MHTHSATLAVACLAPGIAAHADGHLVGSDDVVGHTDRIGNDDYNLNPGLRRAEEVRRFLVEQGPLDPDVVALSSRGEQDPQVACPDLRGQALIDCLAPNRRVELNIRATEIR